MDSCLEKYPPTPQRKPCNMYIFLREREKGKVIYAKLKASGGQGPWYTISDSRGSLLQLLNKHMNEEMKAETDLLITLLHSV